MPVVTTPKMLRARTQARAIIVNINRREFRVNKTERDIVGHKDDPLGILTGRAQPIVRSDANAPASSNNSGGTTAVKAGERRGILKTGTRGKSGKGSAKPSKTPRIKHRPGRIPRAHVDFMAPVARRERAATPDGRTSFHFSVEAISRTKRTVQTDRGTVVRPGSPAAHDAYVNRDAAVAIANDGLEHLTDLANPISEQIDELGRREQAISGSLGVRDELGTDGDHDSTNDTGVAATRSTRSEYDRRAELDVGILSGDGDGAESVFATTWRSRPWSTDTVGEAQDRRTGRVYQSVAVLQSSAADDARSDAAESGASLFDMSNVSLVRGTEQFPGTALLLHFDAELDMGEGAAADLRVRRPGSSSRQAGGVNERTIDGHEGTAVQSNGLRPSLTQRGVELLIPGDGLPVLVDLGDWADPSTDAAGHNRYIARPAALAQHADGTPIMYTNMPRDPDERADLWNRIEQSERMPGPDMVTIGQTTGSSYWNNVLTQPDCPAEIKAALATADAAKPVRFATEDGSKITDWLQRQEGWDKDDPQVANSPGRGGRTQYRVIGELPMEVDLAARARILEGLVKPLETKQLPYVAVMHAPDHTNDNRNWHFHLICYDRPVSRLADGRWDFEVAETYTDKTRKTWQNYPYRQAKDRDLSSRKWPAVMRDRLAELSNRELAAAGINRRLDPRRYEEMGIGREPMEHLGTKAAALEAMGIRTPAGDANAQKDWEAALGAAARRRERAIADTNREEIILNRAAGAAPIANRAGHIVRWRQARDESAEFTYLADIVETLDARSRSRGERVVEMADKRLAAIASNTARVSEARQKESIVFRRFEAVEHLRQTKIFMADKLAHAAEWRRLAAVEAAFALQLEQLLYYIPVQRAAPQRGATSQPALPLDGNALPATDNARPQPALARADQASTRSRYLDRLEMDAVIETARTSRTRLVERNGLVYLGPSLETDRSVETAANWAVVSKRLAGMKRSQDQLIVDVADYIDRNPQSVRLTTAPDGSTRPSLYTPRPQWRYAFDDYRNDPLLAAAAAVALERNAAPPRPTSFAPAPVQRDQTVTRSLPTAASIAAVASTARAADNLPPATRPTATPSSAVSAPALVTGINQPAQTPAPARPPIAQSRDQQPSGRAARPTANAAAVPEKSNVAIPPTQLPDASTTTAQSAAVTATATPAATPASPRDAQRRMTIALDTLARGGIRILEGDTGLTLSPAAMTKLGVDQRYLLGLGIQERLDRLRDRHKAELALLQDWIVANPGRAAIDRNYLNLTGKNIPQPVYQASRRWSADPEAVAAARQTISRERTQENAVASVTTTLATQPGVERNDRCQPAAPSEKENLRVERPGRAGPQPSGTAPNRGRDIERTG